MSDELTTEPDRTPQEFDLATDNLMTARAEGKARYDLFMSGKIADRAELVACFATLPAEAFSYVTFEIWQTAKANGGFQADSRAALDAFSAACDRWIEQKRAQYDPPVAPI
jgi:hypothetical protein